MAKTKAARQTQAQRRAITRARITSAALEALAENGYAAMTFADIATRAGVSRGALLHYFPQKPDIALAAIEDGVVVFVRDLREHVDAFRQAADRDERMLDGLYASFAGSLFQAFLAFQVHARTDPALNERLMRISSDAVRAYGTIALEVWGPDLARHEGWEPFLWLVTDTIRGIALSQPVGGQTTETAVWAMGRKVLRGKLEDLRRTLNRR